MKKMRLFMRLFAIFSLAFVLNTFATPGHAQKVEVQLNLKNKPLTEVLELIRKQSGYDILYSNELLKHVQPVNVTLRSDDIDEIMQACLQGNALDYEIQNGTIIIKARTAAPQTVKVQGHVIDAKTGQPMPGVTVAAMANGTAVAGAATDADGKFSMNLPEGIQELTFSFVGYKAVTLPVQADKEMTVRLEEEAAEMDEVVVNGYFTRQKNSFTGAAKTIKSEELLATSPTNVLQALSILEPSMQIMKNNEMGSNPNYIPELIIRGATSLATSNEVGLNTPLIVIDGVESTLANLYDLNVYDIESISILKDASATALYGENAANGVIIIERKRVAEAPLRIRYDFMPEFSFADLSSYDLCDAAQKLELEKLAGLYESPTGAQDKEYYRKYKLIQQGVNTDWIHKPIRNSASWNHSVSVTGRASGLEYNVTARYATTNGVMKDDNRRNLGFSAYLSYRLKDKLVVTFRGGHDQINVKNSKYGDFSKYLYANPYDLPYDEFGDLNQSLSWGFENPLYEASLKSFDKSQTRTLTGSLDIRYNIKPNLYITAQGTVTSGRGTSDVFVSPNSHQFSGVQDPTQRGKYTLTNNSNEAYTGKIVGNYIHSFDDRGTILTLNVGGEIKKSNALSRTTVGVGFLSEQLSELGYASNYPTGEHPSGSESLETSVGGFLAANFIFRNRYFIDGSYRLSGSSLFGADNRFAPFWAVGAGYNLHQENFIKNLTWVNMLRLRGSYGHTGSVKFPSYQAITTYKYDINYSHYNGIGAIPITMGNPNLTWQTTRKTNIGLTSSFLKERLNVNFDYFFEYTDDMLIDISMPPSSGTTKVKDNFGRQKNVGCEFSVWGKLIDKKGFFWTLSWNGIHNKTTILDISDALRRQNDENATANDATAPRVLFEEGGSPNAIYAVRSAGIDPASGKEIFITKEGNYTFVYNPHDKVEVGDQTPKLQGAASTSFGYKNFSLSLNFQYTLGADIYNSTRAGRVENINPRQNADLRAFKERWSAPGQVKPYLGLSVDGGQTYVHTSRFVEKENELWLSSISMAYEFDRDLIRKAGFNKLRLGFGMSDLFRLSTVKYERGTSYPYSRGFNFTISATF